MFSTVFTTIQTYLQSHTAGAYTLKVCLILGASIFLYTLLKMVLLELIDKLVESTDVTWDNTLNEHGVFIQFAYLTPAIVWYYGMFWFPTVTHHAHRMISLYVLYNLLVLLERLLNAGQEIYNASSLSEEHSIKGYVQSIKLFVYLAGILIAVALLFDKSLLTVLSGIGALTAIFLLIFRDTILSFIASIQISSHNMFKIGDWIEMEKYGANGTVIDIALHKVKIQNWDMTIVAIPTFKFIDESFKNWRGMTECGGRRLKRAIYLDQASVRLCDEEMLASFRQIDLLRGYIDNRQQEIDLHNEELGIQGDSALNGRCMTNLGTFRHYVRAYLERHPAIHKGMPLLVRHLAPGPEGIGVEIYAFVNGTAWTTFENTQADIFDHLLAALPAFELRVYQRPTGQDVAMLSGQRS